MSLRDKIEFAMITFVHDKMYGLFMKPHKLLIPAGLKKGQHVLEVGCGPGFFTLPAAEIVGEEGLIYANDINPFAIKKIEKKIKKASVKNVKTLLEDVTETSLEDNSIDLAFLFGFMHFLNKFLDKVLIEMHRILKDDGYISIQKWIISEEKLIKDITKDGLFELKEKTKRILVFKKIDQTK